MLTLELSQCVVFVGEHLSAICRGGLWCLDPGVEAGQPKDTRLQQKASYHEQSSDTLLVAMAKCFHLRSVLLRWMPGLPWISGIQGGSVHGTVWNGQARVLHSQSVSYSESKVNRLVDELYEMQRPVGICGSISI